MAFFKKKSSKNKPAQSVGGQGWVVKEGGYEETSSPELIGRILTQIVHTRRLLTIIQEGYQSEGTFLEGFSRDRLCVGRPRDFPGNKIKTVVVFRDQYGIRHHFHCRVLSSTAETVYFQFPGKMFRLQRREHYRVDLPPGSTATFLHQEHSCRFHVQDVSTGGMLLLGKSFQGISKTGNILEEIVLTVPSSESEEQEEGNIGGTFEIGKGMVMRRTYHQELSLCYLGIRFSGDEHTKKELMTYIRKREIEILRRGVR